MVSSKTKGVPPAAIGTVWAVASCRARSSRLLASAPASPASSPARSAREAGSAIFSPSAGRNCRVRRSWRDQRRVHHRAILGQQRRPDDLVRGIDLEVLIFVYQQSEKGQQVARIEL